MGFLKGQEIIKSYTWESDGTTNTNSTGTVAAISLPAKSIVRSVYADVETALTSYAAKNIGSINTTSNVITITAHGFKTGVKVQATTTTTLPGGISALTDYYVINLTNNTIALAETLAKALAGTKLDITSSGTGTHTLTPTTLVAEFGDGTDPNGWITDFSGASTGLQVGAGAYASAQKIYAAADTLDLVVTGCAKTGKVTFYVSYVRF